MSQPDKAVVRPRQPLTDRQREFLRHVESLWTDDGPPTVRQLCEAAGFSSKRRAGLRSGGSEPAPLERWAGLESSASCTLKPGRGST
jgi:LexA DNA binding domain